MATMRQSRTRLPGGLTVIAREPGAMAPHPHPRFKGKIVPFRGLNTLLVTDEQHPEGYERFECDECGWISDRAVSVVGHMPVHTPKLPLTPEPLIREVLRQFKLTQFDVPAHVHSYSAFKAVASRLNEAGVKNMRGNEWTSDSVRALVRRYQSLYPVTVRRPRQTKATFPVSAAAETVETPSTADIISTSTSVPVHEQSLDALIVELTNRAQELVDIIFVTATKLTEQADALRADIKTLTERVSRDPEIEMKAAAYDALSGVLSQFTPPTLTNTK